MSVSPVASCSLSLCLEAISIPLVSLCVFLSRIFFFLPISQSLWFFPQALLPLRSSVQAVSTTENALSCLSATWQTPIHPSKHISEATGHLWKLFDAPGTCRDCHSGSHNSLKRMKTGLGKFWLRHPDLADSRGATCSGKGGRGSVCLSHLLSLVPAPVLTLTVAFCSVCFFSTIQERDSEKAHDVRSAGTTISPPLCLLLL